MQLHGLVKQWNATKGYGWIVADDGQSIFVHIKSTTPKRELVAGQGVLYDVEPGEKGPMAANVRVVQNPNQKTIKATGVVDKYTDKGWGFIRLDNGERIFFHVTDCNHKKDEIFPGLRVRCFVVDTPRGKQAKCVAWDKPEEKQPEKQQEFQPAFAGEAKA